ncbi:MAG: hypothetical protein ACE37B_00975 [Ilumatobacter sp.]|uniref:hypothetical protein n=1 Tax=Ilumatobacter sp. TaxID=1967498 RepID=UPI00391DA011
MAERAPSTGWRRGALVVIGVALPLIVAVIALAGRRFYPVLDLAMTEFRLRDVGGRQTPLIGLPGRIGDLPEQGSHPGPLSFWMLAPGYRAFGSSAWAMEAATLSLQLTWISLAMWIGHRRLGWVGVATTAAVVAVVIRGYGLTTLLQPWNPYLPLLAWLVILLATWSVFCGDHLMLLPLVFAASFAAQTHIPYLLMAGGLGLAAVAVVLARWWRGPANPHRRATGVAIIATVGAFGALWLPPLVDQVRRDPGNITRLLDHFGAPSDDPIGFVSGFRLLLRHLDVIGGFVAQLWGDERFLTEGFDPDGPIWAGVVVLAAWIVAVVVARRLDHAPLVRLHAVIGLTLMLSWLSMSRIFGLRWFYLTLWAWTTTALLLVAVAWTAITWWRRERPEAAEAVAPRRLTIVASVVASVATLSMIVVAPSTDHAEEHLGDTLGELVGPTVAALEAGVGAATGPDGVYVVEWDDAYFFGSQAFGLVSELERAGLDARGYDFWAVPMTPKRTVGGDVVTAEVIFATGGFVDVWRADERVVEVVAVEPRDAEELAEYETLRDDLIDDLEANGLSELVDDVDTNLFGLNVDLRISADARAISGRMIDLGQQTAVFIGPPGVTR